MKPHLLSASLLLCSLAHGLCGDIEMARSDTQDAKTNKRTLKAFIRFPEGHIDYEGSTPAGGSDAIRGFRFGLGFWGAKGTDGGWSRWNFLNVTVILGNGQRVEIIGNRMLHDAEILEETPRRMSRYRWPLEETGGFLKVTFLQYPEQRDWMLLRVELEGETGASIEQIGLVAYPSNTTGPKERERWLASGTVLTALQDRPQPADPAEAGFAFFNRMAQQQGGCLLVIDPAPVQEMAISGNYSVLSRLKIAPGETAFQCALGGFQGVDGEEAARTFTLEGARNTLQFLQAADWKPKLNCAGHEHLFTNLRMLLADVGSPEEGERFTQLLNGYQQESGTQNSTAAMETVNAMRQMEKSLIARALNRWR